VSRTVIALYDTLEEAEQALNRLQAEVLLTHADIYDGTHASIERLQGLDLTLEEQRHCEHKMATGLIMLLAQVPEGEDPERIIPVLERVAAEQHAADASGAAPASNDVLDPNFGVTVEERIPVIKEELRVGTREVVHGGARVRTRVEELPVTQDVELFEEFVRIDKRPANRRVSEHELEQAGLLRERVIEIAQVREEAVLSKEAFVREEVVVSKTTERRVHQIQETVRRTIVETEELPADTACEDKAQ
jgi:stress response protein YsnF